MPKMTPTTATAHHASQAAEKAGYGRTLHAWADAHDRAAKANPADRADHRAIAVSYRADAAGFAERAAAHARAARSLAARTIRI